MPLLFGFLLKLLGRAIDALGLRLVSRCLLSNSGSVMRFVAESHARLANPSRGIGSELL
jgi:hypothetical protein